MIGFVVFMIVFIVCATILIGIYMYYCAENKMGMFRNPRYEERIRKLEKHMEELKEK